MVANALALSSMNSSYQPLALLKRTKARGARAARRALDERNEHGRAEGDPEREAAGHGGCGGVPADGAGALAEEVEDAGRAERERRQRLDRAERDPGGD